MCHSSLSSEEKDNNFEKCHNADNEITMCTSTFGAGVDIPNIKFILHYWSRLTVNDRVQESGRNERGNVIGECALI